MRVRHTRIVNTASARPQTSDDVPQPAPAIEPAAEDEVPRRFAARRASAMSGGILVDNVSPPIPCVIRNTSSTGALLELKATLGTWSHSAADLPDDFVLIMLADSLAFDCEVARRIGHQVGVRFKGPARRVERPQAAKPAATAMMVKPATPRRAGKPANPVKSGAGTFGRRGG